MPASASASAKTLPPITIPPLPAEIADPTDLYNKNYYWWPKIAWANPEFHDRVLWLQELIPFKITGWSTPFSEAQGPGGTAYRGPTHMLIELEGNGRPYGVDVVNIGIGEMDATIYPTLFQLANDKPAPSMMKYPGYFARHPEGGQDPVGEIWPEHSRNAANRVIYHVSPAWNKETWPYAVDPPTTFRRPEGMYSLGMRSVISGSWLTGITTVEEYWWERPKS